MKRVLVICFNDLKSDARVTRQIRFLKEKYSLTVFCYDAWPESGVEFFKVEKTPLTFFRKAGTSIFLLMRIYNIAYRLLYDYGKYAQALQEKRFDLIIANDVETLPLAFRIAGRQSKVYLDAHEYSPRQFEDRLYWRIFFRRFTISICRRFIPRVAGMSTINQGLANAYQAEFNVTPTIVTNASPYFDLTPHTKTSYPIKIVHHGIFTLSRHPDIMINMMKLLPDRFTLDLIYLLPTSASQKTRDAFEDLKVKAAQTGRIKILPALKSSEIVSHLHEHYDLGLILIPPVNFNYENTLPNKLFDCIQARIGTASGPLREIVAVVKDYDIGVISEDFTAEGMAKALSSLTAEDVTRFKRNSDIAAKKMNADYNKEIFLDALSRIV